MSSRTLRQAATLVIGACVAGGCAGKSVPELPEASSSTLVEIRIEPVAAGFVVTNPDDLQAQAALALILVDRGRFADAAELLHRLADDQHNEFGEASLRAAAFCYLQAGRPQEFLTVMQDLRERLGPAEHVVAAPLGVEVLFALDAFYAGRDPVSPPRVLDSILPREGVFERR